MASDFGMIYITYVYKAMINWSRHGLWGWIMGLLRSCSPSLRGPLLWWGGLKVKGRRSEATYSISVWWFLLGVVMGVAAGFIYEFICFLYYTWGGPHNTFKCTHTWKKHLLKKTKNISNYVSCFNVSVSYFCHGKGMKERKSERAGGKKRLAVVS